MEYLVKGLIVLITVLHLYFLYFEMFAWETTGRRIFRGYSAEFFKDTKAMAANQGLYNGFLAAGLIWTFFITDPEWKWNVALFFLGCVTVAGIFGAYSASKKILFIQGLPAILTIILLLLFIK